MRSRRTAAALATLLALRPAAAFHDGGAAECEGCHVVHGESGSAARAALLAAEGASATCLRCHAGGGDARQHVLTASVPPGLPPASYTPGGDFAWLRKSFTWIDDLGTPRSSAGYAHGHSIVAPELGLLPDPVRAAAPGGTFPSASLSCTSCHDPHGRFRLTGAGVATSGAPIRGPGSYGGTAYLEPTAAEAIGVYRLLGGAGYAPPGSGAPFGSPPPVALAPVSYNQREDAAEVRVAYGAGMSEWCANCHGDIHGPSSSSAFHHVTGSGAKLGPAVTSTYNAYVRTGDLSGDVARSYASLVPYEEGTTYRPTLLPHAQSDGSAASGPATGQENVTCLSCHRAHASGWDSALRWNAKAEYLVAGGAWPGIDASGDAARPSLAQGRTTAETRGAMYGRDPSAFATFQRTLCEKCHGG